MKQKVLPSLTLVFTTSPDFSRLLSARSIVDRDITPPSNSTSFLTLAPFGAMDLSTPMMRFSAMRALVLAFPPFPLSYGEEGISGCGHTTGFGLTSSCPLAALLFLRYEAHGGHGLASHTLTAADRLRLVGSGWPPTALNRCAICPLQFANASGLVCRAD